MRPLLVPDRNSHNGPSPGPAGPDACFLVQLIRDLSPSMRIMPAGSHGSANDKKGASKTRPSSLDLRL